MDGRKVVVLGRADWMADWITRAEIQHTKDAEDGIGAARERAE